MDKETIAGIYREHNVVTFLIILKTIEIAVQRCMNRYSNPAEVDGFFQDVKNSEHKSYGRDFKLEIPSLRFQAR